MLPDQVSNPGDLTYESGALKSGEEEKKQIQGRTNRRRIIFNSTIQLVVVNLYTEFEVSILCSCGDIFDEKCREEEE